MTSRDGVLVGVVPALRNKGWSVELFDGETLGIPDGYLTLPLKVKTLCKWTVEHAYERLVKCDDDSYIHPERFALVTDDYAGLVAPPNDYGWPQVGIPNWASGTFPYPYASGGCYWLSRRCMEIIANTPLTEDFAEDRWVGNTLGKAGIKLTELPDYHSCTVKMPTNGDFTVLTQTPNGEIFRHYHHLVTGK